MREELRRLPGDDDAAEKAGYATFMLKEIHEQPAAVPTRLPTASARSARST